MEESLLAAPADALLQRIPASQRRGVSFSGRNWKAYDHAFDLAVIDGKLVDEFVKAFSRPLTKYEGNLYEELEQIWRQVNPSPKWDAFPTQRKSYKSEEAYRNALFHSPEFHRALRDRDNRMQAWLERCFPRHTS